MADPQDPALEMLQSLEQRLRRIDFLLHGDNQDTLSGTLSGDAAVPPSDSSRSIASRLQSIEQSLQAVVAQSKAAAELLRLQNKHPDVWEDSTAPTHPVDMSDSALTTLVLSHIPSYHTTAARLTSLSDLPVPNASSSASLIALKPRVQNALQRQEQQQQMVSELRQRSVEAIGRWYELGIVSMGDCWSEWETRLLSAESQVRRAEGRMKRDNEGA
ncbi:hypothetical protein MBLNU459_g8281t1 [Dothideomycetes sp. NU459]